MTLHLKAHPTFKRPKGPVLLVIMDGIGIAPHRDSNAVFLAKTPNLEKLHAFRNRVCSMSESVLTRLAGLKHLNEIDFDNALQEAEKARLERAKLERS